LRAFSLYACSFEEQQVSSESIADVLAIAAHRDDVEQTCGGTFLRMRSIGVRTAILDLTRGESGTRGSSEERAAEAKAAAEILGVAWRDALDIPDGRVENTYENRLKIVGVLRRIRPRVVILPYWAGRHPDHYNTATLGYEACFLSGLAKLDLGNSKVGEIETGAERKAPYAPYAPGAQPPHRPFKIIYASLYADVRPSFVVDITPFIEERHRALMAYRSQYGNQEQGSSLFVPEDEIRERTFSVARHYGLLAGVRYAEPFVQKEIGLVDDLTLIPVQSM
jgi:N-acetylglucosamine malate deacetylase 1